MSTKYKETSEGPDVTDVIHHNRLQAYRLSTSGKLEGELGGRGEMGDLMDSFFLGPPLPVDGRLYVLNQKGKDLRLVCIDPAVPDTSRPDALTVVGARADCRPPEEGHPGAAQ